MQLLIACALGIILIDLDGTLIDCLPDIEMALAMKLKVPSFTNPQTLVGNDVGVLIAGIG